MAASTIKGLTIEINGDTTSLDKALTNVNKTSRDLQSELRQVDKLLKLDPKNTELLAQKQKLLADAVENAKSKLNTLKAAAEQASKQLANGEIGEDQYRALQREVIKAEQNLQSLESQSKETADAQQKAGNEAEEAGNDIKKAGNKAKDAGDDAEKSKDGWEKLGNGMKSAGELAAKAAAAVAAAAVAGGTAVVAMTTKAGALADEINTLSTQTGLSTEEIQKFAYASDIIDVDLETLTKSMAKLTKNMSTAKGGSGAAAEAFAALGVSVTDGNGELRNNQDVMTDVIASLGAMENETQRDAYAMAIFGKSAQDLNPLILGGAEALEALGTQAQDAGLILSQEALDGLNDYNDKVDVLKATLAGAGTLFATAFAEPLGKAVEALTGYLTDMTKAFNEGGFSAVADVVAGIFTELQGKFYELLPKIGEVAAGIIPTLISGMQTNLPVLITGALSLITSMVNVLLQQLPTIAELGIQLLAQLANGIASALPTLIPTIVDVVMQTLTVIYENLPLFIEAGLNILTSLIEGIIDSIPILIEALPKLIETVLNYFATSLPMIIEAGIDIVIALIEGLVDALPALVAMLPKLITSITTTLTNPDSITKLVSGALQIIVALAKGLIEAIPVLVKSLPQIITAIVTGLGGAVKSMAAVGVNLIKGLWNGIGDALGWLKNKILGLGNSILGWIKGIFGIHSPSSETAYFGEMLAKGLGVGFLDSMDSVAKSIGKAANTALDAISPNLEARLSYATAALPNGSSTSAVSNSVVNNSPVVNVTINTSGGLSESDIVTTVNRALGKVFA
jgi:phage-related protein